MNLLEAPAHHSYRRHGFIDHGRADRIGVGGLARSRSQD